MILKELCLKNFGVYRDECFALAPRLDDQYNRPITLFRGKNGVGKSTIVEAIRLCLHGSLVLGRRVSQKEYEAYLDSRIHHSQNRNGVGKEAKIELSFDYVGDGKKQSYRVVRRWQSSLQGKQTLIIEEGHKKMAGSDEEKEQFLRELISPGLVELFFFDGEKIQTLAADGDASDALLANTVKGLLGLDLVDQLAKDLDIYLLRQKVNDALAEAQAKLKQVHEEQVRIETTLEENDAQRENLGRQIQQTKENIEQLKQKIATSGGRYAERREENIRKLAQLEAAVDSEKRFIHELSNGLLPFALVPNQLLAVKARLQREQEIQETSAAKGYIQKGLDDLQPKFAHAIDQQLFGLTDTADQTELIRLVADTFGKYITAPEESIVFDISEQERQLLFRWIDIALDETPKQFAQAMQKIAQLDAEIDLIRVDLHRIPDTKVLEPIQAELEAEQKKLGGLEQTYSLRGDDQTRLNAWIERLKTQRQNVQDEMEKHETAAGKIQLALRTQRALKAYKGEVTAQKLTLLADYITSRFNQLCRKENFLERIEIDAQSFAITLYRLGRPFRRQRLSAGEQQLFALATLWGLKEISGRPMPVLIDTPLSRLDSEHRLTISHDFFPHVSHQVLVLATDAEVDDGLADQLAPVLSHAYQMTLDSADGATKVSTLPLNPVNLDIPLNGIAIK